MLLNRFVFFQYFLPHFFPCLPIDFDFCLCCLCLCLCSCHHQILLYLSLWWCNQFGFYSYPLIFLYSCSYFSRHLLLNIELRKGSKYENKKRCKLWSRRYQSKYPCNLKGFAFISSKLKKDYFAFLVLRLECISTISLFLSLSCPMSLSLSRFFRTTLNIWCHIIQSVTLASRPQKYVHRNRDE